MELKIDGISGAKRLIAKDWPTHIISILNSAGPDFAATTMDRQHDDHWIFEFHDVENRHDDVYVVPSRQNVKDILDCVKGIPHDARVLIHCTAGKSRSVAMAIAIQVQNGMGEQEAFDWAKRQRPVMFPNRLMIEYADDILGLDGRLIEVVATYYRESLHEFPLLVEQNRGGYTR
jgi:predicted protein tyrosine phosphatase